MTTAIVFVSRAFRVAMAERGYTSVAGLARAVGVSPSYLRHVAGGFVPSAVMRERLAGALAVAPDALWTLAPVAAEVSR